MELGDYTQYEDDSMCDTVRENCDFVQYGLKYKSATATVTLLSGESVQDAVDRAAAEIEFPSSWISVTDLADIPHASLSVSGPIVTLVLVKWSASTESCGGVLYWVEGGSSVRSRSYSAQLPAERLLLPHMTGSYAIVRMFACGDATPVVECDSVSASKTKALVTCGWLDAGRRWLVKTTVQTGSYDGYYSGPGGWANCDPAHDSCVGTYSSTDIGTYNPSTCALTWVYSGIQTYEAECGVAHSCVKTRNSAGGWDNSEVEGCNWTCLPALTTTVTYSSENTGESTADLITRTFAALGAYPNTWNGSCSALRDLSPDESSFSIRKFRWRLKFRKPLSGFIRITLNRAVTTESGTVNTLFEYTWSGTGFGEVITAVTEETVPSVDGSVEITFVDWSPYP